MKESGPIALRIGVNQLWQYNNAPINFTVKSVYLFYMLTIFESWAKRNHLIVFRPNLFFVQSHLTLLFQYYIMSATTSLINKFLYLTGGNVKHTRFLYRNRIREFYVQREKHLKFVMPTRHGLLTWLNRYISRQYDSDEHIPILKPILQNLSLGPDNSKPKKRFFPKRRSYRNTVKHKLKVKVVKNKSQMPKVRRRRRIIILNRKKLTKQNRKPIFLGIRRLQLIFPYQRTSQFKKYFYIDITRFGKGNRTSVLKLPKTSVIVSLKKQAAGHLFLGPSTNLIELQNPYEGQKLRTHWRVLTELLLLTTTYRLIQFFFLRQRRLLPPLILFCTNMFRYTTNTNTSSRGLNDKISTFLHKVFLAYSFRRRKLLFDIAFLTVFALLYNEPHLLGTVLTHYLRRTHRHRGILLGWVDIYHHLRYLNKFSLTGYPQLFGHGVRVALFGPIGKHGRTKKHRFHIGIVPRYTFKLNVRSATIRVGTFYGSLGLHIWFYK